ncbi:MAG: helix-turn-helix domain-containing protein [Clostridiales bacterium]|nr:helix-turn-helix domain-containing protein [Clostridiales bacterium]
MKNRIVLAREYAGLTQKELAIKMGISPSTLNGYEKGNHDPKSPGLISIAQICGVTVDYLLGLTEKPEDNFVVTITDTDPQLDELTRNAKQLNTQGLQKLVDISDDMVASGKYEKKPLNTGESVSDGRDDKMA